MEKILNKNALQVVNKWKQGCLVLLVMREWKNH